MTILAMGVRAGGGREVGWLGGHGRRGEWVEQDVWQALSHAGQLRGQRMVRGWLSVGAGMCVRHVMAMTRDVGKAVWGRRWGSEGRWKATMGNVAVWPESVRQNADEKNASFGRPHRVRETRAVWEHLRLLGILIEGCGSGQLPLREDPHPAW